eukprot:SAG31_NODE_703_length_12720_cov_10.185088_2_plen_202_part_00
MDAAIKTKEARGKSGLQARLAAKKRSKMLQANEQLVAQASVARDSETLVPGQVMARDSSLRGSQHPSMQVEDLEGQVEHQSGWNAPYPETGAADSTVRRGSSSSMDFAVATPTLQPTPPSCNDPLPHGTAQPNARGRVSSRGRARGRGRRARRASIAVAAALRLRQPSDPRQQMAASRKPEFADEEDKQEFFGVSTQASEP